MTTANDYDEAIDGDLSDQRFNPTCFDLEAGINRLTATQQGTASGFPLDRDYMTIIIPPGLVLAELRVTAYDNPTDPAFIGFQEGTRFVGAPILITAGDLLGGHVYRAPGFVAMAGGSLGNLCLGGEVGRFPGTLMSDASGALELPIDWNELPMPSGSTVAAVGETWYFQVWHREGAGASHFTPGWSVLIE